MTASTSRRGPARRAMVRWAWRLFGREWRQQVAIIALLTIAVAASVWTATFAGNAASKAKATLGDARAMVVLEAADAATTAANLARIEARFGPAEVVHHVSAPVPGIARALDIRAQDPDGRYSHGTLAVRSGRYPTAPDEIALTDDAAAELDAHVGSTVTLERVPRTVVGIVENPRNLDDQFALVAPSAAPDGGTLSVLIGVDHPLASGAGNDGPGFDIVSLSDDSSATVVLVVVATTVAMALVGLVAATGFLVVAQRRQRQLGLVSALGATERDIRLVLAANGAFVGLVAAPLGTVLGIGAWFATAPIAERSSAHRIDRMALPWGVLAFTVVIAIAAAVIAAWWPSRALSRLSVMAAIARRPTRPVPVHRSAVLAVAVLVGGEIAIALSKPQDHEVKPWLLVAGMLAVIGGTVLVAPSAIKAAAAPARRLPFAARLALRDLVRHQARAAAALAAITLALGIAIGTTVVARASAADKGAGNLPPNQLLVSVAEGTPFATDPGTSNHATLDQAVASVAAAAGSPAVLPLELAMPSAPSSGRRAEPVALATPVDHGFSDAGRVYVATPELLARYGIDPASITDDTDLLTGLSDVVLLDIAAADDPRAKITTPTQHVHLSSYTSAPEGLITPAAMLRHHWTPVTSGYLLDAQAPFTSEQRASARRAAAAVGLTVEARDTSDPAATIGHVATVTGVVLALAILAMTIGLIRGESIDDVRTLTAVGASGRTRRAISASASGALALLGVVLGTVGAYLAIVAAYRSDLGKLSSPPTASLLVLVLGLPLMAAAVGWALAGHDPEHLGRQPG